jgi:hypothetical protein
MFLVFVIALSFFAGLRTRQSMVDALASDLSRLRAERDAMIFEKEKAQLLLENKRLIHYLQETNARLGGNGRAEAKADGKGKGKGRHPSFPAGGKGKEVGKAGTVLVADTPGPLSCTVA